MIAIGSRRVIHLTSTKERYGATQREMWTCDLTCTNLLLIGLRLVGYKYSRPQCCTKSVLFPPGISIGLCYSKLSPVPLLLPLCVFTSTMPPKAVKTPVNKGAAPVNTGRAPRKSNTRTSKPYVLYLVIAFT